MMMRMPSPDHATDSVNVQASPSIRLVVPYFGERPPFLPLVMRSMAANPDVSWLLLTDRPAPDAPRNVAVQMCTFDDLANRIRSHFDFEISLETPYKLCDFRPAFGEIFADELSGYDFWGHSDLEVIFGHASTSPPPPLRATKSCSMATSVCIETLWRPPVGIATRWARSAIGTL